jgi:hypothetical protein
MPTRKQRRRRAKEKRHEYVWEDAEGNELDPSEVPARRDSQPTSASRGSRGRPGPQPPSWRRTLKRGLIFAPVMFVTVMLLGKSLTVAQQLLQTLLIVAIFLPFSYLMDGFLWRSHERRTRRLERQNGRR